MIRYVWIKESSEWVKTKYQGHRVPPKGIPATPPTRIIPDEELPYANDQSSSTAPPPKIPVNPADSANAPANPTILVAVHPVATDASASHAVASSIELEALPADDIESSHFGSDRNILSTFWDFLTLYWRN
jgi:hypothetical protein